MESTTHLELHSQATRLVGDAPNAKILGTNGTGTLYGPPFEESSPRILAGIAPLDYNSTNRRSGRFSS